MFLEEARSHCKTEIEKFVECSKREGFFVIFNCREENRQQNLCAKKYSTQERWNAYREKKINEYVEAGLIPPVSLEEKKL